MDVFLKCQMLKMVEKIIKIKRREKKTIIIKKQDLQHFDVFMPSLVLPEIIEIK